ncbi:hypothetical protein ACTXT7_003187 [Hymenolepis weldensis]
MAANDSLCTIIVIEFLGLSRLVNGLGLCLFCQGFASIFGPPVIGYEKPIKLNNHRKHNECHFSHFI